MAAQAVIAVQSQAAEDTRDWPREMDCVAAGLDVAQILAELHVGADCLVAGILYRAVREQRLELESLRDEFGEEVHGLLQGVLRMAAISDLKNPSSAPVLGQADGQKDNIRRMLIALVDDVRVALIKLAERTCAIRAVKDEDEVRRRIVAQEVFEDPILGAVHQATLLEKLPTLLPGAGGSASWLASHPPSDQRAAAIRDNAERWEGHAPQVT